MKILFNFFLMLLSFQASCQNPRLTNDTLNIDPRQYIKIFETDNTKKKILLWSWSNSDLINQKRKIVDASSTIQIEFEKNDISKNTLFKGNISIEGQIVSSKGGKDPVEVLPYSRIGEEKKRVGLTSRPPTEISTIFVNLLSQCVKIIAEIEKAKFYEPKYINLTDDLIRISNQIKKSPPNDTLSKSNYDQIRLYLSVLVEMEYDQLKIPSVLLSAIKDNVPFDNKSITEAIEVLINDIKDARNKGEFPRKKNMKDRLQDLNTDIKIILQYINYFKSSGVQAEDAFLSFIQFDYISLDNLDQKLKNINEQISSLMENDIDLKDEKVQINLENLYNEALEEIKKLTELESTIIGKHISEGQRKFTSNDDRNNAKYVLYENLIIYKKSLIEYIAHEASKIIYLNLDYATIDLLKERANEGDYLYIFAVLEETDRRAGTDESKIHQRVLPIGRYELRNTGWVTKISDSFVLAHRINEPDPSVNPNISPSNFKGAPGASLLLTRRKNGSPKNIILNALQPSFGVDVSYIDFNRNDDVEVGVGLVLGLFDNKLFCVGGLNLNSTGSGEVSPYYFGLGFSFANIAGKLIKN